MAITFSCHHCGKSLTTSDDKAGRKAKCPGCGEVLTVPETEPAESRDLPDDDGDGDADLDVGDLPDAPPPVRKKPSREGTGTKTCPMCGAENPRRARKCDACGEEFEVDEDEQPRRRNRGIRDGVEIGEVMSDAWEIFKNNFGIAFGGHIISAILMGMGFIPLIVLAVITAIMMDQQNGPQEPPIGLLLGMIPAFLVGMAVVMFMMPGVIRFFISLARRDRDVELTMIFQGGRFSLTYFWVSLVYGLCMMAGIVVCVVPVVIFLWPLVYVACDDGSEEGNYFGRTLALTKPNWVTSLLLIIVMFAMQMGLAFVGAIPCIGPIISLLSLLIQPYFQLIWATAYVKMSGQD